MRFKFWEETKVKNKHLLNDLKDVLLLELPYLTFENFRINAYVYKDRKVTVHIDETHFTDLEPIVSEMEFKSFEEFDKYVQAINELHGFMKPK